MTKEEQIAHATLAGCSVHHLVNNLYRRAGPLKQPRPELLIGLVGAWKGQVSLDEAIDYFLVQPVRKLAAELESSQGQGMTSDDAGEVKGFNAVHQPRVLRDVEQMGVGV